MRTYHTKDGQQVSEREALDDHGCLRDGHSIRTPVMLMDGVPVDHAPLRTGTAVTDTYNARIGDEWKNIPPTASDAVVRDAKLAGKLAGIKDPREAAYARRDAELQDAWR
jgi:hypothetical protein